LLLADAGQPFLGAGLFLKTLILLISLSGIQAVLQGKMAFLFSI
jgi:hypothetical protein